MSNLSLIHKWCYWGYHGFSTLCSKAPQVTNISSQPKGHTPMYTSTEVLAWIGIAGGIGFFTGIAVTLSYEDLLDKKRCKTIKKLKARLAEAQARIDQTK